MIILGLDYCKKNNTYSVIRKHLPTPPIPRVFTFEVFVQPEELRDKELFGVLKFFNQCVAEFRVAMVFLDEVHLVLEWWLTAFLFYCYLGPVSGITVLVCCFVIVF